MTERRDGLPTDNPFFHRDRQRLTDQGRAKLFAMREGRCHKCTRKIPVGDAWIAEHVIALENGGTNDLDNLDLTCSWCKPKKDADDHGKAAKARSVYTKMVVPSGERKPKGRPMPGTRASGQRKRMDGTVERWS